VEACRSRKAAGLQDRGGHWRHVQLPARARSRQRPRLRRPQRSSGARGRQGGSPQDRVESWLLLPFPEMCNESLSISLCFGHWWSRLFCPPMAFSLTLKDGLRRPFRDAASKRRYTSFLETRKPGQPTSGLLLLARSVTSFLQALTDRGGVALIPVRRSVVEESDHRHCPSALRLPRAPRNRRSGQRDSRRFTQ